MTEPTELEEPEVADVPEPDQEPHEPIPDEADEPGEDEAEAEAEQEREEEAPPEASGTTPEEWERRFQRAERRAATYEKNIREIWEEDEANLVAFSLGAMAPLGFIDLRERGRVPDEIKGAILEFLGFTREQDYEPDPNTQECRTCKGKGKTATGSHVAGKETRACPTCNGSGAEGLTVLLTTAPANGASDEPYTLAAPEELETADADSWGQPRILPDGRENPNWGRMPQYWVQVEPWGDTRNLPAQSDVG